MSPDKQSMGPPGRNDGDGATPDPADVEAVATQPHTDGQITAPRRQRQRNPAGHVFRDGFRRGALDALRVAAREVDDPHMWVVLDRLAERYDDPDEYGLAR
jgi:hypothetical protein